MTDAPPTIRTDDPARFDLQLHAAAADVTASAIDHMLNGPAALTGNGRQQHVTLVDAPAGAGKTTLVVAATVAAHSAGLRTLLVTPGNAQVNDLTLRIADALSDITTVAVLHRHGGWTPDPRLASHDLTLTSDVQATDTAAVVISTVAKIEASHQQLADSTRFDLVIVDEAYQASAAATVPAVLAADRLLAVGDPGQLEPFSTDPSHRRWAGHPDDPVQSLATMLTRRHGTAISAAGGHHQLPLTRRLPASAATVLGRFYDSPVAAWARPDARTVRPTPTPTSEPSARVRSALTHGWTHLLLPAAATDPTADLPVAWAVAEAAAAAVTDTHLLASETSNGHWSRLEADRVAVLVTYRQQQRQVEHLLAMLLPDQPQPVVGTADRLQGGEWDLSVVWHPLAGAAIYDPFRGATGRLAVMLSRHRHGCLIVGRASDQELFNTGLPPVGEWDGTAVDPTTRGWLTHQAVLDDLESHATEMEYRLPLAGDKHAESHPDEIGCENVRGWADVDCGPVPGAGVDAERRESAGEGR